MKAEKQKKETTLNQISKELDKTLPEHNKMRETVRKELEREYEKKHEQSKAELHDSFQQKFESDAAKLRLKYEEEYDERLSKSLQSKNVEALEITKKIFSTNHLSILAFGFIILFNLVLIYHIGVTNLFVDTAKFFGKIFGSGVPKYPSLVGFFETLLMFLAVVFTNVIFHFNSVGDDPTYSTYLHTIIILSPIFLAINALTLFILYYPSEYATPIDNPMTVILITFFIYKILTWLGPAFFAISKSSKNKTR